MKNKFLLVSSLSILISSINVQAYPFDSQNKNTWYGNIKFLYMEPSNINYYETFDLDSPSDVLTKTRHHLAYDLVLGYFLTDKVDISLNYVHANFKTTHSKKSDQAATEEDNTFVNFEKVSFLESFNSLAMRLGSLYNLGSFNMHPFFGLDYTTFKHVSKLYETYPDFPREKDEYNPQFEYRRTISNGIGPQLGFDSSYPVYNNFTISVGASISVLGAQYSHLAHEIRHTKDADTRKEISSHIAAFKQTANFGVNYHVPLNNTYMLDMELGYQNLYLRQGLNETSGSLSLHGPYLAFNIHGAK